jgi:F-type H+-transporting ATPase subunit epsilon
MSHDIDLEKARTDLERCKSEGAVDDDVLEKAEAAWAEARVRAAEKAS